MSAREPFHPSFLGLIRLPPKLRLAAGILFLAGGVALTVFLWDRGVVWGFSIFAVTAGGLLTASGAAGIRSESKRRALLESINERKEEILQSLIEAKRQGKNPVRLLNEQGIVDPEVRTWFLEAMKERTKD
jgi:hypothetical protein